MEGSSEDSKETPSQWAVSLMPSQARGWRGRVCVAATAASSTMSSISTAVTTVVVAAWAAGALVLIWGGCRRSQREAAAPEAADDLESCGMLEATPAASALRRVDAEAGDALEPETESLDSMVVDNSPTMDELGSDRGTPIGRASSETADPWSLLPPVRAAEPFGFQPFPGAHIHGRFFDGSASDTGSWGSQEDMLADVDFVAPVGPAPAPNPWRMARIRGYELNELQQGQRMRAMRARQLAKKRARQVVRLELMGVYILVRHRWKTAPGSNEYLATPIPPAAGRLIATFICCPTSPQHGDSKGAANALAQWSRASSSFTTVGSVDLTRPAVSTKRVRAKVPASMHGDWSDSDESTGSLTETWHELARYVGE